MYIWKKNEWMGVSSYTMTTRKVGVCPEGNGAQDKRETGNPGHIEGDTV